ncbi:polysaccharide biosynthesis/export family protein [Arcicella sp. LKC2W]|uniref:polysaccharide biosynthesis/export family protein n=1 Tax=Arcicella sp. LKC2W TaxID=2984198 RepID=UPI002B216200|nr:polysaccharide biosynthesis/export family protein [Arcicella sp. LKC2W]MEA5458964.1 polysaccharide biosynthesis/export family protein [Arcicella sp. LKC2W]
MRKKNRNNFSTLLFNFLISSIIASSFFLSSCVSTKQISYFQGDTTKNVQLAYTTPIISKIQTGDILAITVSSLNQESNEILNFPNVNSLTMTNFPGQISGQRNQPLGVLVDSTGCVVLAFTGKIKIVDLNLEQAAETIRIEMNKYLKEPAVNVRFLNRKFSILGEVNKPAVYNLLDDKTTILEALSMAGDITIYGQKQKVILIREKNGKREMAHINLLSREVFSSPYYYIQTGDLIYVEPSNAKATYNDRTIQLIPVITGITTTLILLLTFFKK